MSDPLPDQDQRLMAALAHGSVILFGMGAVASVVIYATQKEKSRFTAYQALQATVYQIVGFVAYIIGICCWLGIYLASMIPLITADLQTSDAPSLVFLVAMALMVVPFALMGIWTIGGLWAAFRCLQGGDFQYPVIGHRLERWLAQN